MTGSRIASAWPRPEEQTTLIVCSPRLPLRRGDEHFARHAREVKRGCGIDKPPTRSLVLEADVALLEALDPEILCPAADRSNAPKVFLTESVNSGVAGSRPITNHRGEILR